ncbi:uncharacterized protein N7482_005026 [Penicillium canariense]|uniref:Major facilitator superfamily (MFS) profile domain-containing protein n=1 Tax=Penicillium canariense TaxID=189055 RepID=A0A9W9I1M0_9EURO|nr:uncharacterized protein N7482_005026 [Penicillium canariense]KAJ5166245.1 hypothetical protein N7482_005026 [Penicillium canariense]
MARVKSGNIRRAKLLPFGLHSDSFSIVDLLTLTMDFGPPDGHVGRHRLVVIVSLSIVSFLSAFDSTVFPPVLPTIAKDLHGNSTDTFWVGTAYLLPCAALQPFLCALSDVYGRRSILLLSITLFAIGSVVGAVANNMATILAGRTIQGIGGGGLIPLPMIVMTDIFPLRERPKYTAYVQLFSAIGIIIGPVMGGLFTQHAANHGGWRWVFYVNFPFCLIAFLALYFALRKMKVTRASYRNIDWGGSFLFTASMVCFLMGLSWGGTLYKWNSYRTLLPLCLGAVGIGCTLIWECYGASWPFLPLSVLKSRASIAVYLSSLIQGISMFGILYYITFYLEVVQKLSPTKTGAEILALSATMVPAGLITAILISKSGKYKWAQWKGWVVSALATGLLCRLDTETKKGFWIGAMILLGLGHGILFNSILFAAQAVVPAKNVAYAATLYTFFRTMGYAVGVVVGSTTLENVMADYLKDHGFPAQKAQEISAHIGPLKDLSAGSGHEEIILQSYVHGLRGVFMALTCLAGLGLITTFFVPQASMDQPLESDHQLELLRAEPDPPTPSLRDYRSESNVTVHSVQGKTENAVELHRVI